MEPAYDRPTVRVANDEIGARSVMPAPHPQEPAREAGYGEPVPVGCFIRHRDVFTGPSQQRPSVPFDRRMGTTHSDRVRLAGRSVWIGGLGAAGLALLYAGVVWTASGSFDHLVDQIRADRYLLMPIIAGFGVQVGLLAELHRRRRMYGLAAGAGAAGAGASTVGMVACCAHHIADLVPFVGATAAATFLYDHRLAFMLVGLGVNAVAVAIVLRRLQVLRTRALHGEEQACAVG